MKFWVFLYLIGLVFTFVKVYYDFQSVTGYEKKLIISFMADALLVISIGFSCFPKLRFAAVVVGVFALLYFYVVLGFGGRGSAHLSCELTEFCGNSVNYVCTNINSKPFSGSFYLFGTSLKIISATLILRDVWTKYKGTTLTKIGDTLNQNINKAK